MDFMENCFGHSLHAVLCIGIVETEQGLTTGIALIEFHGHNRTEMILKLKLYLYVVLIAPLG